MYDYLSGFANAAQAPEIHDVLPPNETVTLACSKNSVDLMTVQTLDNTLVLASNMNADTMGKCLVIARWTPDKADPDQKVREVIRTYWSDVKLGSKKRQRAFVKACYRLVEDTITQGSPSAVLWLHEDVVKGPGMDWFMEMLLSENSAQLESIKLGKGVTCVFSTNALYVNNAFCKITVTNNPGWC